MLWFACCPLAVGSPPSYEFKAIHIAAREGNLLKVKFLVAVNPTCVNEPIIVSHWSTGPHTVEHTPLLEAAGNGHLDVVKYLVEHGARINVGYKDSPYAYPLTAAAGGGYFNIVAYLIDKGADVNAFGLKTAPLFAAAKNGHFDIAQYLIDKGAIVNIGQGEQLSAYPLHGAVLNGDVKLIALILDHGADLNAAGTNFRWPSQNMIWGKSTALHIAAAKGDLAAVQLLIQRGANTELRDAESRTAGDVAREYGRTEIATLLGGQPTPAIRTPGVAPSAVRLAPPSEDPSSLVSTAQPYGKRFGLEMEGLPFDVRKLLLDSGAQNVPLPELEQKALRHEPLTEQEKDLLRKLKRAREASANK